MNTHRLSIYMACLLLAIGAVRCGGAAVPAVTGPTSHPPETAPVETAVSTAPVQAGGVHWPSPEWQVADPEAKGMDPGRWRALAEAAPQRLPALTSLLIVRAGDLVLEEYFGSEGPDSRNEIYSCTKSFMATLVGIAIDKGYISGVDTPVLDFFPERAAANPDLATESLALENLLTMTSGLEWDDEGQVFYRFYTSQDWVQFMLDLPIAEPPGSRFNYCTGCSHLLSAILEQATGMNTLEFARQFLFEPIGMGEAEWLRDPAGTPIGGWGLHITPRDMARLGYLYLRNGVWEGRQVVSEQWVKAAVTPQVKASDELDYGYQWWVRPSMRGYAAIGRDGQMIAVIPEQELVVVFTSSSGSSEPLFEFVEEDILLAADQ